MEFGLSERAAALREGCRATTDRRSWPRPAGGALEEWAVSIVEAGAVEPGLAAEVTAAMLLESLGLDAAAQLVVALPSVDGFGVPLGGSSDETFALTWGPVTLVRASVAPVAAGLDPVTAAGPHPVAFSVGDVVRVVDDGGPATLLRIGVACWGVAAVDAVTPMLVSRAARLRAAGPDRWAGQGATHQLVDVGMARDTAWLHSLEAAGAGEPFAALAALEATRAWSLVRDPARQASADRGGFAIVDAWMQAGLDLIGGEAGLKEVVATATC